MLDHLDLAAHVRSARVSARRTQLSKLLNWAGLLSAFLIIFYSPQIPVPDPKLPLSSSPVVTYLLASVIGFTALLTASRVAQWLNVREYKQHKTALIQFLKTHYPAMVDPKDAAKLPGLEYFAPISTRSSVLITILLVGGVMLLARFPALIPFNWVGLGSVGGFVVSVGLGLFTAFIIGGGRMRAESAMRKIMQTVENQRDYRTALEQLAALKMKSPKVNTIWAEGYVRHAMGDYDAAEQAYWQILPGALQRGQPVQTTGLLGLLGDTLMSRERWDEALPFLEQMIIVMPSIPGFYSGLLDYYLRLPGHPHIERAIEVAQAAESVFLPRQRNLSNLHYFTLAGHCALALALAGKTEDARAKIAPMRATYTTMPLTVLEGILDMARALEVIGDLHEAQELFAYVRDKDPQGVLGKAAAEKLAALTN